MRQVVLIVFGVIFGVGIVALLFTYLEVQQERFALSADMQYRTRLLADSLNESIEPARARFATSTLEKIATSFAGRERLLGVVIYDDSGNIVARSKDMPDELAAQTRLVEEAVESDAQTGDFVTARGGSFYVLAHPLHRDGESAGAFTVVQDAAYIDESIAGKWRENLLGVFIYILLFAVAIITLVRFVIWRPLANLAEAIKSARAGNGPVPETKHDIFFRPLATEIGKLAQSLSQARSAASEEARMRHEKIDTPWTAERLREFVKAYLKDRPMYVVSNREPYIHTKVRNKISYSVPAHGMVTAVESVMAACGGVWLAHASGNADKETADLEGKIRVPPEEPRYTLKRVWLSDKDVEGHYTGFSNEALFPLCLLTHTRPIFRKEDWIAYTRVNGVFADALLAEIKHVHRPIILVQDLHFALLPRIIKKNRPDAQIGLFWHHPWPSPEQFSICPWRKDILDGMLGSDVIGFHTQQFCNNFLETVGKEVESLTDFEKFVITRDGHESLVRAFPISIAFTNGESIKGAEPERSVLQKWNITSEFVGLGVDRLDYSKGILERFKGIENFFDAHPEYKKRFTFIQIAPGSRESVLKYREYGISVAEEAKRINSRLETDTWKPIIFEKKHLSHAELVPLYRAADFCLVTSLHDGMNLVSKEFVAARDDESGVLILSKFTGASRELIGAIPVNPYSTEEIGMAMYLAIKMPLHEQRRRMRSMRTAVKEYNVYRWAAEFIKAVVSLG